MAKGFGGFGKWNPSQGSVALGEQVAVNVRRQLTVQGFREKQDTPEYAMFKEESCEEKRKGTAVCKPQGRNHCLPKAGSWQLYSPPRPSSALEMKSTRRTPEVKHNSQISLGSFETSSSIIQ